MTDIDALIARMYQPGPVDDSPGGYERDQMTDSQADREYAVDADCAAAKEFG